ncbi:LysR family transcriptional regulator, partial [Citrobacter sp. AAK_AS5]
MPNRSHGLRETIERFARGEGVELNVALEMDSLPQIKELVARGSGYSILAHSAARRELESREVVLVPIDKPVMRRTVHLVRNPV